MSLPYVRVKEEVHELLQSSGDVTESMLQKVCACVNTCLKYTIHILMFTHVLRMCIH